jgi:hypothetical protein
MHRAPGAALLVAWLAASAPVLAADPVAAEALFAEGRQAAERGDYRTACERFGESERLDPAPGTLMNLGECKARLGLVASAWQHYREAADRFAGDPRQDVAVREAAALEPRLSRLRIGLAPAAPTDTVVERDGERLGRGSYGVAVPVDPGAHRVVISAPGHRPRELQLPLAEGQVQELLAEPGPPLPPSEPGPDADGGPPRALGAAGFVLGGLGLASLGVGIVTGFMTMDRKDTVERDCPRQLCNQEGFDAAAEGRTLSAVSTATFVAGLAAVATGVVLVIVDSTDDGTATAVSPLVSARGAGLSLARSF